MLLFILPALNQIKAKLETKKVLKVTKKKENLLAQNMS